MIEEQLWLSHLSKKSFNTLYNIIHHLFKKKKKFQLSFSKFLRCKVFLSFFLYSLLNVNYCSFPLFSFFIIGSLGSHKIWQKIPFVQYYWLNNRFQTSLFILSSYYNLLYPFLFINSQKSQFFSFYIL